MSRNVTKSILSRDEISLLIHSEEPKKQNLYGNLYNVLKSVKHLKAITIGQLDCLNLDNRAKAALSYNKKSLMDIVNSEWYVEAESAEDEDKKARCGLCNTPNKYLFFIRNRINNEKLNVGSSCMKKFQNIEGYSDYKNHLNKKIKNRKIIERRNIFYQHCPNAQDILDSSEFYFDHTPIAIPYDLFYNLKNVIKELYLTYRDYVIYSKGYDSNPFERFNNLTDQFYKLKEESDAFILRYKNHPYICKRNEIDWLMKNHKKAILDQILSNDGIYDQDTAGKILLPSFIHTHLSKFINKNEAKDITITKINSNDNRMTFVTFYKGFPISYLINTKLFMKKIGGRCIVNKSYTYSKKDILSVSYIVNSISNIQNTINAISDDLNKFGYIFLIAEDTEKIYLYKKQDKSIKEFSFEYFIESFGQKVINNNIDIYKFISSMIAKQSVSYKEQERMGLDGKINKLYYQQYIAPYN